LQAFYYLLHRKTPISILGFQQYLVRDLQKPNPMNLLRKLTELSPVRFISQRVDISKKDLVDFFLLAIICFMIIVYKVNKASY
jgi:hypothetical protein